MAMLMINGVCDRCGDTNLPMTWTILGKLICLDCKEDLEDIRADREDMGLPYNGDTVRGTADFFKGRW